MRRAIKNVILWSYGRTAWQYDVLCVLILAFIFLTPKSWFEGKGRDQTAENAKITRLVVGQNVLTCDADENLKLQRVRELSGNAAAQIVACRKKTDADGNLIAYEVDVR